MGRNNGEEGRPAYESLHDDIKVAPLVDAPDQEGPQDGRQTGPGSVHSQEGPRGLVVAVGPVEGYDAQRPPQTPRGPPAALRLALEDGPLPPRPGRTRRSRRVGDALRGPSGERPRRLRPRVARGNVCTQAGRGREGPAPVVGEEGKPDAPALPQARPRPQVVVGAEDNHPVVEVLLPPDAPVPRGVTRSGLPPGVVVGLALGVVPEGPVQIEGVEEGEDGPRVLPRPRRSPGGGGGGFVARSVTYT